MDITIGPNRVVIADNGQGLAQEEDIYRFFEVFGFDHSKLDRQVGRFGVGRGQLFCFGVNTWRTHGFEMAIDIRGQGLDYQLRKGLPSQPGMEIQIDLYDRLAASEQLALEEQLRKLVRYSSVPIFFNGEPINDDPAKGTWSHETDSAWFQVRKDGRLEVYSQGLYVKDVYGHDFGVGGRIVIKPFEEVLYKDLKPDEKAVAYGLRQQMRVLAYLVAQHHQRNDGAAGSEVYSAPRVLAFFNDNQAADVCTDGARTIWLNRATMMVKANRGVAGFMELTGLLVHEYLHSINSQTAHSHPAEFYEDFHDLLLDGNVARYGLSAFAASVRHGHKPTPQRLSQLEKAGVEIDVAFGLGSALTVDADPAAPAPRWRRRASL